MLRKNIRETGFLMTLKINHNKSKYSLSNTQFDCYYTYENQIKSFSDKFNV